MKFRSRILLGMGVLAIVFLLLGDRRIPTAPQNWTSKRPISTNTPPRAEFHVGTFNIHGCKGSDDRRDVRRVASLLRALDIVGLNEVHGNPWGSPQDQVAELAALCGVPAPKTVFAPAETQWFGTRRFGNGLLTRCSLLAWERTPLPRKYDRSCRNMLLAEIAGPSENVAVLVTHITRSNDREREIQLEAVLARFASLEPPAILLADLNTPPGDPRMDQFFAETDAVDAIKEGGVQGSDRVDWIVVRGLQCLGSQRIDTPASDHPLFTVRLADPNVLE